MKKRITVILLAMVSATLLAGCCLHHWEDATCTDPKTCAECGETKGDALGHDWEDATCEEPKTCSACGKTRGEANGHEWNGVECAACGKTRPEPGEAGAVTWDVDWFLKQYEMFLMAHNQPMSIGELEKLSDTEYTFTVYYEEFRASQITLTVDPETDYITHILAQEDPVPLPDANRHGMGHNSCGCVIYAALINATPQLINGMYDNPVSMEEKEDRHWWLLHVENMRIEQTHNLGESGWITTVEISCWDNAG